MNDCFAFRFFKSADDDRQSLGIFFAGPINFDAIAKTLKKDVMDNLAPRSVYLISHKKFAISPEECGSDAGFSGEFSAYVGDLENQLICVSIDGSGSLLYHDGKRVPKALSNEILRSGMITLFRNHNGLIVSKHGYHFAKPSGDHCDKFIRASNLLVSSLEVSFLATAFLPYLNKDVKRIYVDTSSICFLISVAIQLYGEFHDGVPSIHSFASYAVLNEAFDFVEDKNSLVVISATTSGSLAKKLSERGCFSYSQIVTLFHVNLPKDQIGVFDVSSALDNDLVSHKAADCDFCKRGSKVIRIAGDQFLPENPQHEQLVIRKDHFSKRRQIFFRQFASANVLLWDVAASKGAGTKEHFFIAVDRALDQAPEPFSTLLQKNIKKHISRDVATVIVFDDPGSVALENHVRSYLSSAAESMRWLKPGDLDEASLAGAASVLVLVGAITSGRSLLAVSRKLRCIDGSATITYMVAFSKLPNETAYKQLEKDLCQGGHDFVVLNRCPVPRIKEHTKTAWDSERKVLLPIGEDDSLGELTNQVPDLLLSRRAHLNGPSDPQKLFLSTCEGKLLSLRRTFAFWSDLNFSNDRLTNATQSDVYWTIQSVLHDLRNESENKQLATTYHTTLISPANFDRYNDGVIQACLLRAAHPVEMDYRVDPIFSRQMTDVILSVLKNWRDAQGEAVLEFLMALWTRRLRVNDEHLQEIVAQKSNDMPDAINFILDRLNNPSDT